MTLNLKKLAWTAITLGGLSIAALGVTGTAAEARTVCDWRGCYTVPGYGYYDRYDRGWRRDWRDRRDWERRHYYRDRYYYGRPYYDRRYRGGSSGSLWFNF